MISTKTRTVLVTAFCHTVTYSTSAYFVGYRKNIKFVVLLSYFHIKDFVTDRMYITVVCPVVR